MAKILVKIGETESEVELTSEQLTAIKTESNFLTREEALASADLFDAHKNKHRKEVLDGFDATIKKFENLLTSEEIEEYKKGETTFKKTEILLNKVKARIENSGDKNELEVWKAEVEKLKESTAKDYVLKADFESAVKSNATLNKQIIGNYAVMEAVSSGKLADYWVEQNALFKTVIKEALNETLKTGLDGKVARTIYDAESGEIKVVAVGDGNLPIIKSGTNPSTYWTFSDLVQKAMIDKKLIKTAQAPPAPFPGTHVGGSYAVGGSLSRLNELKNKVKQE